MNYKFTTIFLYNIIDIFKTVYFMLDYYFNNVKN